MYFAKMTAAEPDLAGCTMKQTTFLGKNVHFPPSQAKLDQRPHSTNIASALRCHHSAILTPNLIVCVDYFCHARRSTDLSTEVG